MNVRKATTKDFEALYDIGVSTRELRVSSTEPFMDRDDFRNRIEDRNNVFMIAEQGERIVGFICASWQDEDKPLVNRYACLVYLVVIPEYRNRRVASMLFNSCICELKKKRITHVYCWASAKSDLIQTFLLQRGFNAGEKCLWMDRKI